ncbi:hypothetical protein Pstr01_39830 [Pseudomonas straminea]|uniref:DUF3060 domain-containing protein n=1 Tax=Pseudomonas straminea TaxID=47882 RepID=A0A1I1YBE6_PSEOC|nr:DUF3060 domain-containing protein [Pseudomonas straminea]GLX15744.1 hypothetical protein Pstr01_39830 [Pseudomonas straminea]SFE16749.1 Protein of unknown function [Pseudomonas straminea]
MNRMQKLGGLLAGMALTALAQAEPLNIEGIGLSRDISCKGQDVNISGNANVIHLKGDCGAVEVSGSEHKVTLGTAKSLSVSGAEHEVVAERVNALSVDTLNNQVRTAVVAGEQSTPITVAGTGQKLDLRLEGETRLDVSGIEQQVRWSSDEPQVQLSGADNKVERQ